MVLQLPSGRLINLNEPVVTTHTHPPEGTNNNTENVPQIGIKIQQKLLVSVLNQHVSDYAAQHHKRSHKCAKTLFID